MTATHPGTHQHAPAHGAHHEPRPHATGLRVMVILLALIPAALLLWWASAGFPVPSFGNSSATGRVIVAGKSAEELEKDVEQHMLSAGIAATAVMDETAKANEAARKVTEEHGFRFNSSTHTAEPPEAMIVETEAERVPAVIPVLRIPSGNSTHNESSDNRRVVFDARPGASQHDSIPSRVIFDTPIAGDTTREVSVTNQNGEFVRVN